MMIYWLKMVIFRRYDRNGDFMGISPIKLETSWDIFIIGAENNDWNLRIFHNPNGDFTSHSFFFVFSPPPPLTLCRGQVKKDMNGMFFCIMGILMGCIMCI